MTAVLLAAGCARRLVHLTRETPKCLLDVGGKTLIRHQLDAMRACGVDQFIVVVGFWAEKIRNHLGDSVRYVLNEVYDSTNSLYSLSLALPHVTGGMVLTNADVLFHPKLLSRLVTSPHPDALLYEPGEQLGAEEMKVRLEGARVTAMSKSMEPGTYHGENLGVLKFSAEGVRRLRAATDELIGKNELNAWAPMATDAICKEYPVHGISSGLLPWIEVDFPADLERARKLVWPRIKSVPELGSHCAG
ncbi:MAG: phosphocholine cytidylyltransferase family protein [Planctomycetota bacterium]